MKLGRGEAPAIGRAEQENSKRHFLGLQADGRHCTQPLLKSELAETMKGFLALERDPERVTVKIAEDSEPTKPDDKLDEVVIESFLLRGGAKRVAHAHGNDGGGSL